MVMDGMFMKKGVKVWRGNGFISYIIEDKNMFSETGYKVLRNNSSLNLMECSKVFHNGKIKLVYNTGQYSSLMTVLSENDNSLFVNAVFQIIEIIVKVNETGFLDCNQIDCHVERILIDREDVVKLICLPIKAEVAGSYVVFESHFKSFVLGLIDEYKINGRKVKELVDVLNSDQSLESLLRSDNKQHNKSESKIKGLKFNRENKKKVNLEKSSDIENKEHQVNTKKENNFKMPFGNVFLKKKVEKTFMPSIILKGINTPEDFVININKVSFIIGSHPNVSDGTIHFNKAISRSHCKIVYMNEQYFIVDLGSSNGTYLNDVRLDKDVEYAVGLGDKIKLANSEFVVQTINQ